MSGSTTQLTRRIGAPARLVFQALLDARCVQAWKVPDGMRCQVHTFEPWPDGRFRVSLSYEDPNAVGKSAAHTDTYQGRFVRIEPDRELVEVLAFETSDPAMAGEMKITWHLAERDGATELTATHENVPAGIRPQDNLLGWSMALDRLAALVEARHQAVQEPTGRAP